ncbi:RNA recognition motif domain [Fusarium oxysporum f. sp. vasinfectum]|nr:RNA recognition motif domain [Fusarium oxysporum f. sp. vasinfectum]WKT42616.1 RNA recognition motif domain [Fusarium oxysporum f. sp. vasinfectum]
MASNGNFAQQDQYKEPDEVGWYFVEQFYTTLSKSPEKLHLFYGKRSQFVYGREAEVAKVSVGRQDIQERIKNLDFHDCKVRISNVDSQASFENIVIQVIGETCNNNKAPKKFVQTFVLAQQPSGYFVLNDILRYIDDESDDESAAASEEAAEEPAAPATEEPAAAVEPEATQSVEETKEEAPALDPEVVDQKLEEVSTSKESVTLNGSTPEEVDEAKAPETKPEVPAETADEAAKELAEEDVKEPEKPKDPSPTPVSKPVAAPPAAPEKPAAPPKPMTWASRAAAALPKPVVPLPKTTTPPDAAGWQTAGSDSKRQNRPQSVSGPPADKESTTAYVKFVTDKVQDADLRNALTAFGELKSLDIIRQKNCAFVEFKTPEASKAAVAANPHTINGETIVIESRRNKPGAHNAGGRGPVSGRGRGGAEGGRSGGQGPRGNFSGQNRGRGGAPRGRGGAQSHNA